MLASWPQAPASAHPLPVLWVGLGTGWAPDMCWDHLWEAVGMQTEGQRVCREPAAPEHPEGRREAVGTELMPWWGRGDI